jgi:hypothetical protein
VITFLPRLPPGLLLSAALFTLYLTGFLRRTFDLLGVSQAPRSALLTPGPGRPRRLVIRWCAAAIGAGGVVLARVQLRVTVRRRASPGAPAQ